MAESAVEQGWKPDRGLVEISVKFGDFNSVVLTTRIKINWSDRAEATQRIREATQVLMKAGPVAELRGMDQEYFNDMYDVGLDAKSQFALMPKIDVSVKKKQDEVRERLHVQPRPQTPRPQPQPSIPTPSGPGPWPKLE